ncbi:unnamed protein product [Phytophthora lilii]|uniref:Unnamed protein product n=1 Tax=Phytophthora lilii TaxID=2077276 RepID=A0A9W6XII0_9STRA|nr:unnamed protein product [Phytophthora lilii]
MNYGALAMPSQGQTPPLSASAIKTLRESVHQQLPLQFRVASTTAEKDFVVYNCSIGSAMTDNSWSVSYRYSDFAAFTKNVEDQWTCHGEKCSGSCSTIREFIWACFPHKRLSIMAPSSRTIADRKQKFETVVKYLLRCALLPGSAMMCFHARSQLPANLFTFLHFKQETDKRSVLQVFVDNYQSSTLKCCELETRHSFHSDASTVDSIEPKQCMICLDDVVLEDTNDKCHETNCSTSIVLPCQHEFHRDCIFEWLLFQFRCPVCRARIGPPATTSYCHEKGHVFQWWLSSFDEDPLTA